MGVLIKDMEMPKACRTCPFFVIGINVGKKWNEGVCRITLDPVSLLSRLRRFDCPLGEISDDEAED